MGVLVIGMHRSGTSALAGALETLGLTVGPEEGLMGPDLRNPAGYYEQWSIAHLNDEMLDHMGGSWDCPPELPSGWLSDQTFDELVLRASDLVRSSFETQRFVLKDPRIAVLLPLWRRALLDRCSAIIIVRDPVEVAWSLQLRDAIPALTGLALWSAYYRAALIGLEGLPVHVCRYEALVAEPRSEMERIARSLQVWDELPADLDLDAAAHRVQPTLRRDTWPRSQTDLIDLPKDVADLDKLLTEHIGQHDHFECEHVPVATWERSLLEERRRAWLIGRSNRDDLVSARRELEHLRGVLVDREGQLADLGRRLAENEQQLAESQQRLGEATAMLGTAAAALDGARAANEETDRLRTEVLALTQRWDRLEHRLPVRVFRSVQRRYRGPTDRPA